MQTVVPLERLKTALAGQDADLGRGIDVQSGKPFPVCGHMGLANQHALGTDLAPAAQRGEFLGLWRLLTDFGTAAGPMVVSSLLSVAPLGLAALGVAALGGAGSYVVYRYVEETLPEADA